jgi:hypothetical protein
MPIFVLRDRGFVFSSATQGRAACWRRKTLLASALFQCIEYGHNPAPAKFPVKFDLVQGASRRLSDRQTRQPELVAPERAAADRRGGRAWAGERVGQGRNLLPGDFQMTVRPILLVEDNPMDVDLTLRAFKERKLANPIEVARDGEEALAWIPRWEAGAPRPVVILLDVNMPKVGGFEVLRELKSHPVLRTIPVVMLTTSSVSRDVQTAYEYGANSYIVKPVDFDRFMEVAAQIELYWAVLNQPPE